MEGRKELKKEITKETGGGAEKNDKKYIERQKKKSERKISEEGEGREEGCHLHLHTEKSGA